MGSLLAPLAGEQLDVLVSNPPYIAFDEAVELPASVRDWEPSHALFSGGQGLDATRKIIDGRPCATLHGRAARARSRQQARPAGGGARRVDAEHSTKIQLYQDLVGRDRFVLATRT